MSQINLNAYNIHRGDLVQNLINSHDLYLEEPEHLREPADLLTFLTERGITPDRSIDHAMLERVRGLRSRLRDCWTAQSPAEMIALLNPLLAGSAVIVQVGEDEEHGMQLQFTPATALPMSEWLQIECALGIADTMQQYGVERMRACAASPCRDVFVDVSRNKTRRFCSERCANRYNIAAFRDRQKG